MKSFNCVPFGLSMPQSVIAMCAFEPNVRTERSSPKARNYDDIDRMIALFVRCSPGTLVKRLGGQAGAFVDARLMLRRQAKDAPVWLTWDG
jgi:hypothetical protein